MCRGVPPRRPGLLMFQQFFDEVRPVANDGHDQRSPAVLHFHIRIGAAVEGIIESPDIHLFFPVQPEGFFQLTVFEGMGRTAEPGASGQHACQQDQCRGFE